MKGLTIVFCLLLTGCGATLSNLKEDLRQQRLAASGYSSRVITPESSQPVDLETLLEKEIEDPAQRNEEQSKLLAKSEVNCNYFVESVHFQRAAINVWFGTLTTVASTAAAIVSGRAGQNLAGAAAVFSSTSNSINQEMYSGVLMPAITKEILDGRKLFFEDITTRQQGTLTEYPFSLAVTDAIKYHNLCSVPFALVNLVNKAGAVNRAGFSSESAIAALDDEIAKKKSMLGDMDINFSDTEKQKIRNQILDLMNRREILSTSMPPPKKTASFEETSMLDPVLPDTADEDKVIDPLPAAKQFNAPISVPFLEE